MPKKVKSSRYISPLPPKHRMVQSPPCAPVTTPAPAPAVVSPPNIRNTTVKPDVVMQPVKPAPAPPSTPVPQPQPVKVLINSFVENSSFFLNRYFFCGFQ